MNKTELDTLKEEIERLKIGYSLQQQQLNVLKAKILGKPSKTKHMIKHTKAMKAKQTTIKRTPQWLIERRKEKQAQEDILGSKIHLKRDI